MKLRNKKTGEIEDLIEIVRIDGVSNEFYLRLSDNEGRTFKVGFNSLAELNEEWEDYEEPEGWWFIDRAYEPHATNSTSRNVVADQEIGNYFSSKEEAEKAVKRLRAWKRLKDKGFRFTGITPNRRYIKYNYGEILSKHGICYDKAIQFGNDLDLLFGGEE